MADCRLLVTGATGFVGSWTLRHWRTNYPDAEIWATSNVLRPEQIDSDEYCQVDIRDSEAVEEVVSACKPTHVIHLAGLLGKGKLSEHLSVNVLGTENLFNAIVNMGDFSQVRIVQASSASIYGHVCAEELPISENQPPRPLTAYALSKLAQHHLASAMWHTHGLKVINACIFNTVGPFQPDSLVPMTFVKQLKEIKTGLGDRLHVGDTSPCRDFVDIRDIAQSFDWLLDAGHPGETYNIASGCSVSIKKIIELLLEISELQIPIETASKRLRNSDVPDVRADISKIASDTGWKPSYSLYESLKDMWSYYVS